MMISAAIAESLDQKAQYIKNKGFDDAYYKQLIIDYLKKWGKGRKSDFEGLLLDKLPDTLSDQQKKNKVKNLLAIRLCRQGVSASCGGSETQTVDRTRLVISISGKTAQQIAEEYGFDEKQLGYVTELLSDEYSDLWANLSVPGVGSDDIVAVALSQVGNVGGQPYWSWYGVSSRVEWCACFVSWCGEQCGYIESGAMPKHSYRPTGVEWFRSRGQWQDRNSIPAPGTIIYFDWGGDGVADHVGIVESCDGSTVYTIEGNANNACKQLSYTVGDRRILGYGTLAP